MNTLIIYDDIGKVFNQITGSYSVPQGGIQFIEMEIPEGKYVGGVDVTVTPHQVILEDIPKTETELLREKVQQQEEALVELATMLAEVIG